MLAIFVATIALHRSQEISQADLAVRMLDTCDVKPTTLNTIRAINQVVSLGPAQAKKTLDSFFEDQQNHSHGGLYLFIRCIFVIPRRPGFLSLPKMGKFDPMPPGDLRDSPRFPCMLSGDIPLWMAKGVGQFGGFPEPQWLHYQRLAQIAQLRTRPLVPIDQPWRAVGATLITDDADYSASRASMNAQILDLVSTAYRNKGYVHGKHSQLTETPQGWRLAISEMQKTHMRWDQGKQMYVRGDGSVLPSLRTGQ